MRQIFRLQNIGTSIGIALPPTLLRAMGLAEGQVVVVSQTADGALLIQPKQSRKKYTAAKLNALCNSNAPMPSDLTHWEQVKPVGSEAW